MHSRRLLCALLFSCVAFGCQTPAGAPCVTLHSTTSEWANLGWGFFNVRHTKATSIRAVRADGSWSVRTDGALYNYYVIPNNSGAYTLIDLVSEGRMIGIFHDDRKYVIYPRPLQRAATTPFTSQTNCSQAAGTNMQRVGDGSVAGIPVIRYAGPFRVHGRLELSLAPSLGCRPLQQYQIERNSFGLPTLWKTEEVTRVELGEPKPDLFQIPQGYTERKRRH